MKKLNKGKIDVIQKYYYPVVAGIEVNTSQTYSVLANSGWKVNMHVSQDTLTEKNVLSKKETYRGVNVIRYKFGKFGFFPKVDWDNANVVALHNFNIFPHFPVMIYTLFRKLIGKKNYKLFLTPHGGYNPEWSVFPLWQSTIKRLYHFTLGALMVNLSVDGVRAVSEWEKEWMIKRFLIAEKIRVIPNGLEDEAFTNLGKKASADIKKKVKSWGKYIIQVGRVYPIKNYETTIKALALLPKNINFVIVGPIHDDEGYKNDLIDLAKSLGVEKRVIFAGVIKGADKFYLINRSITMVHMAIWESFCNVVHEALSQRLFPIVANNTALPYLIKDGKNGYVVNTYDYKGVAKRIKNILLEKNSKSFKALTLKNKEVVKEHSWSGVAMNMDKFYRSVNI